MTALRLPAIPFERAAPWFVGGVVLAVAIWAAQPYPVGVFHDDGVYVLLAKAIAGGDGYRYLHLPDAPIATHYPPGYPMLLALLWGLHSEFPRNVGLMQLANAVALALCAVAVVVFARRILRWTMAAAVAAGVVATLSYPLIGLSGYLLAETPFAAALVAALIVAERAAADEATAADAWLAGLAAGSLTLVKSHAIALIAGLAIVLLLRRRPRHAAYAVAGAMILVAPWITWVAVNDRALAEPLRGAYGSYTPWLLGGIRSGGAAFVGATIAANARELLALFADRFSLADTFAPRAVTALVAALVTLVGAARLWRRAPVTVAFSALYTAIVLVWPWTPWRFLYAVWPIVILSMGAAAELGVRLWPGKRAPAVAALAVIVLLALGALRADARAYRDRAWTAPARRAAQMIGPSIRWVAANTRADDIVAVDGEPIVHLFTGRLTVPSVSFVPSQYLRQRPVSATAASMRRVLSDFPVAFVAPVTGEAFRAATALSAAATDSLGVRLVLLERFPSGGAFRVERRDPSPTTP